MSLTTSSVAVRAAFLAMAFAGALAGAGLSASDSAHAADSDVVVYSEHRSKRQGHLDNELPRLAQVAGSNRRTASRNNSNWFIEFRARRGFVWGHALVMYGHNRMARPHVAGLYPKGGGIGLNLGHILPVAGSTSPLRDDYDESMVTARYRIRLTALQGARLARYVSSLKRSHNVWHISTSNCLMFTGKVALYLGLDIPHSTSIQPEEWIRRLARVNSRSPAITLNSR